MIYFFVLLTTSTNLFSVLRKDFWDRTKVLKSLETNSFISGRNVGVPATYHTTKHTTNEVNSTKSHIDLSNQHSSSNVLPLFELQKNRTWGSHKSHAESGMCCKCVEVATLQFLAQTDHYRLALENKKNLVGM